MRMVEAGLAGRVAGQQRLDRVVGPGRAQLLQQPGYVPGVVEAGAASRVAGQQDLDRLAVPGRAELP